MDSRLDLVDSTSFTQWTWVSWAKIIFSQVFVHGGRVHPSMQLGGLALEGLPPPQKDYPQEDSPRRTTTQKDHLQKDSPWKRKTNPPSTLGWLPPPPPPNTHTQKVGSTHPNGMLSSCVTYGICPCHMSVVWCVGSVGVTRLSRGIEDVLLMEEETPGDEWIDGTGLGTHNLLQCKCLRSLILFIWSN